MGVAKAALESVTRYLARDLGPKGIRVNLSRPGRCARWRPSRSPASPRSRTPGTGGRRWAGTSTTRCRWRRRCARCCRTGCPPPPARWCGRTAGSTRSACGSRIRAVLIGCSIALAASSCSSSAARRGPRTCGRSWRTSPAGRGVPPERLDAVEEHYQHFGGVSPLNARNRELIAAVRARTDAAGVLRQPQLAPDGRGHRRGDGPRRGAARAGVRHERLRRATRRAGSTTRTSPGPARPSATDAPELVKLRHFFDHPLFVAANADAVRGRRFAAGPGRARGWCSPRTRCRARRTPRPGRPPRAGTGTRGRSPRRRGWSPRRSGSSEYDVVWQSRSGPPQVPWLAPDILDHLDALHAAGAPAVVVAPVGFVSDHVEVVWDLDTEARERAAELGMALRPGGHGGPGPAVRGHGGRAGGRAHRRRRAARRCRRTCRPRAAP